MTQCKDCKKKDVQTKSLLVEITNLTSSLEDSLPASPDELTFTELMNILQDYLESIKEIILKK